MDGRPSPPADEQLRALATSTSDVIITIDTESIIQFVNPAVESVLGYTPDELIGEPLTRIMTGDLASQHRRALQQYLDTGERTLDWSDIQLPGQHKTGDEVPLSISFSEFTVAGDQFFTGILRDITDRTARTRDLECHEKVLETLADGVYMLDDDDRFVTVNEAFTDLTGYSREELLGAESSLVKGEEAAADLAMLQADLEQSAADVATFETTIQTAGGEPVPVEVRISLFPLGDGNYGRVGVMRDVTERNRREAQFQQLNHFAQSFETAETVTDVWDITTRALQALLPLPLATIYAYDDSAATLTPVATTPTAEDHVGADGDLFAAASGLPWTVYTRQDEQVIEDIADADGVDPETTPLRSVIAIPLGPYGVVVAGATTPDAFQASDVRVAELLAADVEAALDRVDREQMLRSHAAELEAQTATLERVNRINDVIRDLTTALIQADTRDDIEQAVCTRLASADPYRFVWVGEPAAVGARIEPRASAGVERGYLDAVSVTTDDQPTGNGPVGRAVETHQPQTVNDIHADPPFDPWRREALTRGYQSCIAVPLLYKDALYGVLNLYADEVGVFDDLEVDVLSELGQMMGYALNAVERKKALVSSGTVELKFNISNLAIAPVQIIHDLGGRFEYEELVEQADGSLRAFFTVEDAPVETVLTAHERWPEIQSIQLLAEEDDNTAFYEATLAESSFSAILLEYGAHLTELTATSDGAELTVELPQGGDISAFLRMFLSTYDAELLARRELDRPVRTDAEFTAQFRERLTDREEEVLRTAYHAGFFETPRQSSGSDIAEMLDVSQPTVNRHLRSGERKLLELVFEPDAHTD